MFIHPSELVVGETYVITRKASHRDHLIHTVTGVFVRYVYGKVSNECHTVAFQSVAIFKDVRVLDEAKFRSTHDLHLIPGLVLDTVENETVEQKVKTRPPLPVIWGGGSPPPVLRLLTAPSRAYFNSKFVDRLTVVNVNKWKFQSVEEESSACTAVI